MKHLIDRVLELQEDEITPQHKVEPVEDLNLNELLKSLQPRIRVFGMGGAGSNAVARLEAEDLFDDEYVKGMAINTDAQHLLKVAVKNKILIGRTARGRGAGGDPFEGEKAAFESERILKTEVENCDLAFITAGLGGGSGTGSAPVLSRLAKSEGALTIAVVSYPFLSEGSLRKQNADWGLERLKETCDTVIVLPNERLLEIDTVKELPLDAAFRVADELLVRSISGVSEMISKEGIVNLDFQDLKAVLSNGGGIGVIGLGEGKTAEIATNEALENPLLDMDISDARGALINVVGGPGLSLGESEKCAKIIREKINPYARIIWGVTTDESLGNDMRVLLVLTGVKSEQIHGASMHTQMKNLRSRTVEFIS
jgi:cell division protein FtsZ